MIFPKKFLAFESELNGNNNQHLKILQEYFSHCSRSISNKVAFCEYFKHL